MLHPSGICPDLWSPINKIVTRVSPRSGQFGRVARLSCGARGRARITSAQIPLAPAVSCRPPLWMAGYAQRCGCSGWSGFRCVRSPLKNASRYQIVAVWGSHIYIFTYACICHHMSMIITSTLSIKRTTVRLRFLFRCCCCSDHGWLFGDGGRFVSLTWSLCYYYCVWFCLNILSGCSDCDLFIYKFLVFVFFLPNKTIYVQWQHMPNLVIPIRRLHR